MSEIDIEIEDAAWTDALPDAEALVRAAAQAAAPPGAAVAVLLTSDGRMREMNDRFRGKDAPTNVLSFPADGSAAPHIGDIAVAFGVTCDEAQEQDKPLCAHLQHLIVHGVLHLLGYDHEDDNAAEEMETLERRILAGLGLPDPYA